MWQNRSSISVFTVLTVCFALNILCTPAHADDVDLTAADWSITAPRPFNKYSPTLSELEKLVNDAVDSNWTMPICSYKFIDVYDGSLRLVVSLDTNGRHFCNELVVLGKTGVGVNVVNKWNVIAADHVNDMLSDFDGDHSPELIVTFSWSKAETGRCQAKWRAIYKWSRGRFMNQSASFAQYYKNRLKDLAADAAHEADPSCTQMEADKISRLLGSPRAGYDRALNWMKSSDASLRRKAAAVFADINDDASKKNLATLGKDADPLTAESAKLYLVSQPRFDKE